MANDNRYITAAFLFGMAALSWYAFTNIGDMFFGSMFAGIINLAGIPIAILFTAMFAIFGVAVLMLDVQQYPQFFLASVLAVVALILWISPLDFPGPIEELLVSLVSGLFFKKSLDKPKKNDNLLTLL